MRSRRAALGTPVLHVLALAFGVLAVVAHPSFVLGAAAATAFGLGAAAAAFRMAVPLPHTPPALHPVLFCNPRSGGGKVLRFRRREQASARGIEPIELMPGDNLEELVHAAVKRGADALAVAGATDRRPSSHILRPISAFRTRADTGVR